MTEILATQHCEACRRGAPTATEAEIATLSQSVPEWTVLERDGILRLERVYRLRNFVDAMAFANAAGEAAEAEGHHPALLTEWGRVTVTWWSHKIRGLHRNDFIMASKTDLAYRPFRVEED